jgi:hypothetical protein
MHQVVPGSFRKNEDVTGAVIRVPEFVGDTVKVTQVEVSLTFNPNTFIYAAEIPATALVTLINLLQRRGIDIKI